LDGWEAWQRQTADGAVESEQRLALVAPVVAFTTGGAAGLGETYWREVERATSRFVQRCDRNGHVELRVLGRGPVLLRFGAPVVEATADLASCRYAIRGGLLARRAGGEIAFAQVGGPAPFLRSTIRGFFPRLAARDGEADWTGALYTKLQARIHVAISRRYFARLVAEART
jgi:hypothetical protein